MVNSQSIENNNLNTNAKLTFWQLILNKSKVATARFRHKLSIFTSQFIGFLQEPTPINASWTRATLSHGY